MAASLDANLGNTVPSGALGTVTLTTVAAAAAGTRIIVFCHNYGAETPASCASSPALTWVRELLADDANNATAAVFSADCPAGLASGSTITVTYSASASARGLAAASFFGVEPGASGYLNGTPAFSIEFGTNDFSTPTITTTGGALLFAGIYTDGQASIGGTVTGPAAEIHDAYNGANLSELLTGYQVLTSGGTNSISGTFATTPGEQKYLIVGFKEATGAAVVAPDPDDFPKYPLAGRSPI